MKLWLYFTQNHVIFIVLIYKEYAKKFSTKIMKKLCKKACIWTFHMLL